MRPRARRRRARAAGRRPRRSARSRSPTPPAPRTTPVRPAKAAADARADAAAAAGLPRIGQNRLLAPRKSPMTSAQWPILYRQHLTTMQGRADAALARAGLDHLVVPSGTLHYQFFDDRDYPYAVNPQFKAWLPLTRNPG